jgi:hypothetical protein
VANSAVPAQIFTKTQTTTLNQGTNYNYGVYNDSNGILELASVQGGVPGGAIVSASATGGTLPPGVTVGTDTFYSNNRAALHGTPTATGTYNFTVTVTWNDGVAPANKQTTFNKTVVVV